MSLTTEELLALHSRRCAFELVLTDQRVQGALIATNPWRLPQLGVCACCCYPTIALHVCGICAVCAWEDDLHDDATPDAVFGGNAGYSLNAARRNFIESGTKWRPTDAFYEREMKIAAERAAIVRLYDAMLPNVRPWLFIGSLPRLERAYAAVYKRKYGKRTVRKWHDAARHNRRRGDRDWEVRTSVAELSLPLHTHFDRLKPPSIEEHAERLFQTIASETAAHLEQLLGREVPAMVHRGRRYRCWSLDGRDAWLKPYGDAAVGLTFKPQQNGRPEALLAIADKATPEELARRLADFFNERRRPSCARQ